MLLVYLRASQKKALKDAAAAEEAKAEAAEEAKAAAKAAKKEAAAALAAESKAKKEAAAAAAAEVRQPYPTPPHVPSSTHAWTSRASGQGGEGEQHRPDARRREEGRRELQRREGGLPRGAHRRTGGRGR